MHPFRPAYPVYPPAHPALLTTPERVNAAPDYTGRGVVMAFIDSGFYEHPDIAGRVLAHVDCTTDDFSEHPQAVPAIESYVWHGQMSSVIAAGDGRLSGGKYRGIASSSHLVLIKVSSPDNAIKEADILRGFQWLLAHHRRYAIRVVNVSVGGDYPALKAEHPLHQAVQALAAQGVTCVIAAGNRGEAHLLPPASAAEAIIVGGYNDMNTLDRHRWQPYHSNYGVAHDLSHKPDVVAPAIWVAAPILPVSAVAREARWLGTLLNGHPAAALETLLQEGQADLHLTPEMVQHRGENLYHKLEHRLHELKLIDPHYQHVEGTSVAAPIVSAVVAQLLEIDPALTPAQIAVVLRRAGRHIAGIPPHKQGAGALDALRAVQFVLRLRDSKIYYLSQSNGKHNHAS
ncbi:MAG: S8 family serine peptidase [Anaerolineae bacterium]|jgi:serine protease AprX|nr:S8 family serine peptidase [Anaerolineae bacterium]